MNDEIKMEAGELELRKAFEEVTTRNVNAAVAHGNETRKLTRELEKKVEKLEGVVREQNATIDSLKLQLSGVQTKLFSGGTS
jgi:uncharacterized coiled-coil protein SlyX